MFFASKNSLIVPYDYTCSDSFNDLEEQIQALKEHYRLATLNEVVDGLKKKRGLGLASIVFESPRKGVFIRALPTLLSLEVPFFLFIDPDYVGLNRLPMAEELELYRKHYSEIFSQSDFEIELSRSRKEPEKVDQFLKECRKKIGPLPIETIDPLSFFATWGKIVELSPENVGFGISFSYDSTDKSVLEEKLAFMSRQLKTEIKIARAPIQGFSSRELKVLEGCGIEFILGHQVAPIDKKSPFKDLPIWKLT